jgi:hypothetical protein
VRLKRRIFGTFQLFNFFKKILKSCFEFVILCVFCVDFRVDLRNFSEFFAAFFWFSRNYLWGFCGFPEFLVGFLEVRKSGCRSDGINALGGERKKQHIFLRIAALQINYFLCTLVTPELAHGSQGSLSLLRRPYP